MKLAKVEFVDDIAEPTKTHGGRKKFYDVKQGFDIEVDESFTIVRVERTIGEHAGCVVHAPFAKVNWFHPLPETPAATEVPLAEAHAALHAKGKR